MNFKKLAKDYADECGFTPLENGKKFVCSLEELTTLVTYCREDTKSEVSDLVEYWYQN